MSSHETTQPVQLMGGTDGCRDKIIPGNDPTRLNPTTAAQLTVAFIKTSPANLTNPDKITGVVGGDTRPSTPALSEAVIAGAVSVGAKVINMGVAPTPAVQWNADRLGAEVSVSITASHNLLPYNGVKLMDGSNKPNEERVKTYSEQYWEQVKSGVATPTEGANVPVDPEHLEIYIKAVVEDIERTFGRTRPLEGKIFVVDGANGAAMNVTPRVLAALGATIEEFACDGSRPINEHSGAAHLEGVQEFLSTPRGKEIVNSPGFVGALSNDGDGDRLIGTSARLNSKGETEFQQIDGNRILMLLAKGEPGVVGTEYTNPRAIKHITKILGVEFEYCANGDRHVTEKLREKGWRIGGEFTGHLINLDWLSSGDGVYMAAWLAAYASVNNKTFADIADGLPLSPEKLTNVKMGRNSTGEFNRPDVQAEIEAAEAELGEDGRIVTRESGTEHVYRIWAAGENKKQVENLVGKIATTLAFPKILAEKLSTIDLEDLDEDGQEALGLLRERGYDLFTGLRAENLDEVAEIADQDEVYKYCRRDSEKRYGGRETPQEQRVDMATTWNEKGRLFFQLRRTIGKTGLAGYGCTGPTEEDDPTLTFAVRVSEEDAGKGIGTLLTRVIVAVTRMRTGGSRINLETYGSNHAQYAYLKAGAVQEGDPKVVRRPAGRDETPDADGKVEDTRIRMYFPEKVR